MNKQTLVLALALLLLLIPTGAVLTAYSIDHYERMGDEGRVAYTSAYLDISKTSPENAPKPNPTPPTTQCDECKGTRKIRSGDGLISLPCKCGENCKCQPMKTDLTIEEKRTKIILLITQPTWCSWCVKFDTNVIPALETMNWKIKKLLPKESVLKNDGKNLLIDLDKDSPHIIVANYDDTTNNYYLNNPIANDFNVDQLPTFILIEDGKEIKRHVGYLNGYGVGNFWNEKELTFDDTREIEFKKKK